MAPIARVAVVGAGPSGIASAIFLQRAGLNPLVLERGRPGGLLLNANLVENYPGFPKGVKGDVLVKHFLEQMKAVGASLTKADVQGIETAKGGFRIKADVGEFGSRSVIVATGTRPKRSTIPGSKELEGSRVFYEVADFPPGLAVGKRILVIGGGDAAFDYALGLSGRAAKVTVVSRSEPTGLRLLRSRAETSDIEVVAGVTPRRMEVRGGGLVVSGLRGRKDVELSGDLALIAFGRVPNTDILSPSLRRRARVVHSMPETEVPGLYMVGDAARGRYRQVGIAVGDGICAAMLAEEYLKGLEEAG